MSKKHPWYSFARVNSFNCKINIIPGGRGIGKTYGSKTAAVKKYIRTSSRLTRPQNGEQFIYLRRYKSELKPAQATFFADMDEAFPDYDFRMMGPRAEIAPVATREDKKREWHTMGYFIALSTAQTQKGMSFHQVRTIIFDEFIIESGALRYLPSEVVIFMNFYSTVDRYQDRVKVYMLANSVSIMNPYFNAWKIRPDQMDEFTILFDGYMCVHFPDSAAFKKSVYETEFGKFIRGTEYADYAVENKFADDVDNLIKHKDPDATYKLSIETESGNFSVWTNFFIGEYYITEKAPKVEVRYTLIPHRVEPEKPLLVRQDVKLQMLRRAFRNGRVWFDQPATRNTFAEILTK